MESCWELLLFQFISLCQYFFEIFVALLFSKSFAWSYLEKNKKLWSYLVRRGVGGSMHTLHSSLVHECGCQAEPTSHLSGAADGSTPRLAPCLDVGRYFVLPVHEPTHHFSCTIARWSSPDPAVGLASDPCCSWRAGSSALPRAAAPCSPTPPSSPI